MSGAPETGAYHWRCCTLLVPSRAGVLLRRRSRRFNLVPVSPYDFCIWCPIGDGLPAIVLNAIGKRQAISARGKASKLMELIAEAGNSYQHVNSQFILAAVCQKKWVMGERSSYVGEDLS